MAHTTDDTRTSEDWWTDYAYSLGVQAMIYGFPLVRGAQLRHICVTQPRDPAHIPYAAVNHFWHARHLLDATYQGGGCPNNDTLYSVAWLDLTDEPMILSHPEVLDRYFSFELASMYSDNFDYIGKRASGSAAGHFLIAGPGWQGTIPKGVTATQPSPTPWVFCLGRTGISGADDLPKVHKIQDQFRLTPLSLWNEPGARVPERRDVYEPVPMTTDPLGPWRTLNAMLAENPPPAHHEVLLRQMARVGVGRGLDIDAQPEVVKDALAKAAEVSMRLLPAQFLGGSWARIVNGWRYPPPTEGRAGDDFLLRAAEQSLAGIVANDPDEAVYLANMEDSDGTPLSSDGSYELHFSKEDLPPVDAFWSVTMYKSDMNFVPNPADRYSLGDRTPGLTYDAAGGLTLYIQATSPGAEKESNWLPCPQSGTWFLVLRMYLPHPEVVRAEWRCPPIERVATAQEAATV